MKFSLVDKKTKKIINSILLDDVDGYSPPDGTELFQHDEAEIGDSVIDLALVRKPVVFKPQEKLEEYGKSHSKGKLTHNGFSEDFTGDQRREIKDTIDFLREAGDAAPSSVTWYGTYGEQAVTLSTLVGWLMAGGFRRQKRFIVQSSIRSSIGNFTTDAQIETAFDAGMAA